VDVKGSLSMSLFRSNVRFRQKRTNPVEGAEANDATEPPAFEE
jgi:hypothetical protein